MGRLFSNVRYIKILRVFAVLIIAVIILLAFLMLRSRPVADIELPTNTLKGMLSYERQRIPSDWSIASNDKNNLKLTNDKLNCYVAASVIKTPPAQKPTEAMFPDDEATRKVTLSPKQTVEIGYKGMDGVYNMDEGYIIVTKFYVDVKVDCKDIANFKVADPALMGFRLE